MSNVMNGARARIAIVDPNTGRSGVVGIFNNISYHYTYETQAAHILGRYSPAEIDYVGQNEVSVTCSGYRAINQGPHAVGAVPRLQDLLTSEYIEITVIDRVLESQGKDGRIAKFRNCRATGYNTSISTRNLEEVTINYTCILVADESVDNAESPGSTSIPT